VNIIIHLLLTVVGAWLGWSISMDLSNHPSFGYGSYAFVAFWTVFGLAAGWAVGFKVSDKLSDLELG
jgi:hypothetical protein